MLDITNKDDYKGSSIHKNLIIEFADGSTLDNTKIYNESMRLSEILMEDNQLHFGRCNSSEFSITLGGVSSNIKGSVISPYFEVNGVKMPLGIYTITYVEQSSQKAFKQVTALDNMHKIDRDVTEWYNSLTFPMTQKVFRDSFFEYIGLEQVETTLLFDDLVLDNPFGDVGQINGRTIAEGLCELNATFGHCDREGRFKYVSLKYEGLFPAEDLYPADDLFPTIIESSNNSSGNVEDLSNLYIKASYDEFETQFIERILVIDDYGSQLANSDDITANTYVINNNYLLYGRDKAELLSIMNKFMDEVKLVTYRPASIENKGLPYVELGDRIRVNVKDDEILTYVFNRTLSGIQALRDTYSAEGEEYLINDLNSIQVKMDSLNRKTDRLKIEVTATAKGLESKVSKGEFQTYQQQTAESISSKVSKGNVISEINQSAEEVKIQANKIALEGLVTANNNFKVLTDGSVVAENGTFVGNITSKGQITLVQDDIKITTEMKTENKDVNYYHWWWDWNENTVKPAYTPVGNVPIFVLKNANGIMLDGYVISETGNFDTVVSTTLEGGELSAGEAYLGPTTVNSLTSVGTITTNGELRSTTANGLRIVQGDYGFFIRNDGGSTYFMFTDAKNQYGSYNGLRPLSIRNSDGQVWMSNGVHIDGFLNSNALLTSTGGLWVKGGLGVNPNGGTTIQCIQSGSLVGTPSNTNSLQIFNDATLRSYYSGYSPYNTIILVANGDGNTFGGHIYSATYLSSSGAWYAVMNMNTSSIMRINYTIIMWS